MASLTSAGDNIDWLWGSLKPWQILHSTLAERQRCGNVLDVWELVNQTLSASTITRRQEGDGGRSHAALRMQFLGDIIDGDFWRHGGLMESKVKERLYALKHEEEEEEEEEEGIVAAHHQSVHRLNTELGTTIAGSSMQRLVCTSGGSVAHELSTAPADLADVHRHYCRVLVADEHEGAGDEEKLHNEAALQAEDEEEEEEEEEEGEGGNHGYSTDEDEEEVEEEEDEDEVSNRAAFTHIISRESASVLILSPCCSPAKGAAGNDQPGAAWEETVKIGEAGLAAQLEAPPDVEENIEVCAVCLEKLTHYYEEGVQALACRHAFHTVCIAPWMQRQPHACCPCCRAPIFPANLAPPQLQYVAAPLDVAADRYLHLHDRYACGGLQEEPGAAEEGSARSDIMGLLADMEAALEHLGFRS